MERRDIRAQDSLPGYDVLRSSAPQFVQDPIETDYVHHSDFMHHPVYDKYLHMHKVLVGNSGGRELELIATELEKETLPRLLDAAGWAAAEAGIVRTDIPTIERIALVERAEDSWVRAIDTQEYIDREGPDWLAENSTSFRLALNLAYAPLMKALIVGNITDTTRERTFADTLAIAQLSLIQRQLASKHGDVEAIGDLLGFEHECNAMLALLHLDDPRYVPIPSTARADTGYYHRDQTHDISVINQHWGHIKKVIPMEIKASAGRSDRRRYKSLIIRGKMHLSIVGRHDPQYTLNAFGAVYENSATTEQKNTVEYASSTIKDLLRLYQLGDKRDAVSYKNTQTTFYDTKKVGEKYKELSV